jgi:hypothetical protein
MKLSNLRLPALFVVTAALLGGCASTSSQFNTIEARTVPKIIRLKLYANLTETGPEATRSSGINLEMFRAKVMNTTGIRFVEANEDASVDVSFGPSSLHAMLGFIDKHVEQRVTMRVTEGSGRVIYIVTATLVGHYEGELASELNRVFVDHVIPVLQGSAPKSATSAGGTTVQIVRM